MYQSAFLGVLLTCLLPACQMLCCDEHGGNDDAGRTTSNRSGASASEMTGGDGIDGALLDVKDTNEPYLTLSFDQKADTAVGVGFEADASTKVVIGNEGIGGDDTEFITIGGGLNPEEWYMEVRGLDDNAASTAEVWGWKSSGDPTMEKKADLPLSGTWIAGSGRKLRASYPAGVDSSKQVERFSVVHKGRVFQFSVRGG